MHEMTDEEKADWQRMAESPTVIRVPREQFDRLQADLDAEPRVVPGLAKLVEDTKNFWAESPVISTQQDGN